MSTIRLLAGVLLLSLSCTLLASNNPMPTNFVQEKVADRSAGARKVAIEQAFSDVLIKMTGNRSVVERAAIQAAQPQATNYLQSYHYVEPVSSDQSLQVAFTFNKKALLELLKQAQVVPWPVADRPRLLVMISTAAGDPLVASSPAALWHEVNYAANLRGLPTQYLSSTSSSAVNLAWQFTQPNLDKETAQQLQQQHLANALLILTVNKTRDSWTANWSLWQQDQQTWQADNADLGLLIQQGVDRLITKLTESNGSAKPEGSGVQHKMWLVIMGVDDLATFNKVIKKIKSLAMVRQAEISDTGSDGLLLHITFSSTRAQLIEALNTITQLTAQPQYSEQDTLHYLWLDSSSDKAQTFEPGNNLNFDDF